MKLLLIRHGQSECNVLGQVTGSFYSPLSSVGIKQVNELSHSLKQRNILPDIIYTSSMIRAKSTAELLFRNQNIILDASLNEVDAGDVSEWLRSDFDKVYDDFWSPFNPRRAFPEGESHQEMQNRVVDSVKMIIESHVNSDKKIVAIVAHAGTISSIFHWIYNVPMEFFSKFVVNNASVTMLEWDEPTQIIPHLRFFNYYPLGS